MKTCLICKKEHEDNQFHVQGEDGVCASVTTFNNEVVRAAGTSEGAKKGWEDRKNFAHKLSQTAERATIESDNDGSPESHQAAANHHLSANRAHASLASEMVKEGSKAEGFHHQRAAAEHWDKVMTHLSLARGRVATASDTTQSTDIIHCRAHSAVGEKLGASENWVAGNRVEFMFMPAGVHTICAGFRKGSIELTVVCDQATVEAVQASLDNWRNERPKQEVFACVEHRETEASLRISASCGFSWKNDGVYLAAEPTTLGAQNVNGKIHRSWSPSFTTDADYNKATDQGGTLVFPEGVRGSRSNPAQITGVDFCVGTLTNKPAFHAMAPVKARDGHFTFDNGFSGPPTWHDAKEAVQASGTSEGAKKGWQARVSGAHDLSNEANESSNKLSTMTGGQKLNHHFTAGNAHLQARAAHRKLAEDASNEGVHAQAGYHQNIAEYHNMKWQQHMSDVDRLTKASDTAPSSTITAHCKENLLRDVPDATKAEIAQYEKCIDEGGAHSDAVYEIRKERKNGFVSSNDWWKKDAVKATWSSAARQAALAARRNKPRAAEHEMKFPDRDAAEGTNRADGRTHWAESAEKSSGTNEQYGFPHLHGIGESISSLHKKAALSHKEAASLHKDTSAMRQYHLGMQGHHEEVARIWEKHEPKTKASEPTLDSILNKVTANLSTANRLAEENGVCKLTAQDVYERHMVRATWSDAARKASAEKRKEHSNEHGTGYVRPSGDQFYASTDHRVLGVKNTLHSTHEEAVGAMMNRLTEHGGEGLSEAHMKANKAYNDSHSGKGPMALPKYKASDALVLESIYARAGANR